MQIDDQYNEVVYLMMSLDPLTRTCSRRCFEDAFHREALRAERHQRPLTLLLLEIDFFPLINERFGHLVGNEVLRGLAMRLKTCAQGGELIAHLDHGQFAILLPEISHADAAQVADGFRSLICGTPFETTQGAAPVTASIGVAHYCGRGEFSGSQLLELARRRLYEAKQCGRNTVQS